MEWNEVTKIEIKGNLIVVKDSMIMLDESEQEPEWPVVECQPGEYVFEVYVPEPEYCHRARLRAISSKPVQGQEIGIVDVDHGSIGIIDYQPFLKAISANIDGYEEWTAMELDDALAENFTGDVSFDTEKILYVKSGDGDGSYKVYELVENGSVVGIEVVFIK